MNIPLKTAERWTRRLLTVVCCLSLLALPSLSLAETHGTMVADDGFDIYDWELEELLDEHISSYHSKILCFTECYGGDKVDEFATDADTTILTGGEAGETTDYGGYHRGLAMGLMPGTDTDSAHQDGVDHKSSGDSPTKTGPNVDIGTGGDGGAIQSCHVLVWAGDPNSQDQDDINDIHGNFDGQPNTTVTVLSGDGTGANTDGAATYDELLAALDTIGDMMNSNEQFILFVTDHGDLDSSISNTNCNGVCNYQLDIDAALYEDMLNDPFNEPYLAIFTQGPVPLNPGDLIIQDFNGVIPPQDVFFLPMQPHDFNIDGTPDHFEYLMPLPEIAIEVEINELQLVSSAPIPIKFLSLDSGGIQRLNPGNPGNGNASIRTDLQLAGQTFLTKSPLDFRLYYTNMTNDILGDDETVTGRLRALLFANGKSAGDFSSLLDTVPVLNPGATWCDLFSATVPNTAKSKKVQKILRVPMRAEAAALIDAILDDGGQSYAPFRIEERDGSNDYWLVGNDEGHDIDPADGFGGTTSVPVELGPPDSVFGNEGFWALSYPNEGAHAMGTYLQGPPNAGADLTLLQVDVSALDFGGGGTTPAMVGVFHDLGGVNPHPDFGAPLLPPAPFLPLPADPLLGGDHGVPLPLPSPLSIQPLEPIWVLYFFGGGNNHALGIDNPLGTDSGGGTVDFGLTFFSLADFVAPQFVFSRPGNWIVDIKVNDVAGSFPSEPPETLSSFNRWRDSVLVGKITRSSSGSSPSPMRFEPGAYDSVTQLPKNLN